MPCFSGQSLLLITTVLNEKSHQQAQLEPFMTVADTSPRPYLVSMTAFKSVSLPSRPVFDYCTILSLQICNVYGY